MGEISPESKKKVLAKTNLHKSWEQLEIKAHKETDLKGPLDHVYLYQVNTHMGFTNNIAELAAELGFREPSYLLFRKGTADQAEQGVWIWGLRPHYVHARTHGNVGYRIEITNPKNPEEKKIEFYPSLSIARSFYRVCNPTIQNIRRRTDAGEGPTWMRVGGNEIVGIDIYLLDVNTFVSEFVVNSTECRMFDTPDPAWHQRVQNWKLSGKPFAASKIPRFN